MKASVITALTWAACTMAGPIGLSARTHPECDCEPQTVTITVPAPTSPATDVVPTSGSSTTSPCDEMESSTVVSTTTIPWTDTATNTATEVEPSSTASEPEDEPTNTASEPESEPTNTASEPESEPTNTASEPESEPTNTASETDLTSTVTSTMTIPWISTATNTATQTEPTNTATEVEPTTSATSTGTSTAPPTSTPTSGDCEDDDCHGTGHLIQDLGPQVNRLLTVTGEDGEDFLVQVNEDVYNLLSGRVSLSDSIGEIVGDAASLGDLIADLGPIVDCILTIVGEDSRILLVRLAPEIADLLRGTVATLGLDSVNNPVGEIVQSLGLHLKRDESNLFRVENMDGTDLLIDITGAVGDLIAGLHLEGVVGTVIGVAISVTQLLQDIAPDVDNLIVAVGRETGAVLIRLSPTVADLVHDLLPELSTPLGKIVYIVGDSL